MKLLQMKQINTPLGFMTAISNSEKLILLEFSDKIRLSQKIEYFVNKLNFQVEENDSPPILSIKLELQAYFKGKLREFKTPLLFLGTEFQKSVWKELLKIPYAQTCAYFEIAEKIGNKNAFRAVANANGANNLSIIIPCHRVIQANKTLGGYSGGLERKIFLLELEKNGFQSSRK